jgi:YebC/PmpR family DNA-binding regulatory protein
MSGHSKWSQIKRQKGVNDAKRGAVFTKIGREIAIAARTGGGDPEANYRLRLAVDNARAVNMPADNIKRAIERAVGGDKAEQFEEIVYEGYGPGGVAILVETATDNKNRTAAEVRSLFTKAGGQLSGAGAVAWQFEPRGIISVPRNGQDPDEVALLAIDAGADDVDTDSEPVEIVTDPGHLELIRRALEAAGIKVESAEITMQPKTTAAVDDAHVRQNMRLIENLEDLDDVQRVSANFEVSEAMLAEAASA